MKPMKNSPPKKRQALNDLFAIFAIIALSSSASKVSAQLGQEVPVSEKMQVSVGISKLIKLKERPERIALSNPAIAYVLMIAPDEMQIIGRNVGRTNLFFWMPGEDGKPSKVVGTEISVGLPPPAHITNVPSMEIFNGNSADMIIFGNPNDKLNNIKSRRISGPSNDLPETCLTPGCL